MMQPFAVRVALLFCVDAGLQVPVISFLSLAAWSMYKALSDGCSDDGSAEEENSRGAGKMLLVAAITGTRVAWRNLVAATM